jgi:predicted enzyme involved in methoxymalonyl-ACP biosynthesis
MQKFTFQQLKKNLKKDFSGFKKIKIAVLGDSATQMYVQALRGYGYECGIDLEIFESDYDQIELQAYDNSSELYELKPEYVVIFYSTNKLLKKFGKLDLHDKKNFAQSQLENFANIYETITNQFK